MWSGSCLAGVRRAALVRGAVGGGRGAGVAGQVQSQVGGGAQAAAGGDDLDGQVGGFQQPPGLADAGGGEPVHRRHAGLRGEAPGEGARRPARVPGQIGDGQPVGQVLERPLAGGRQALTRRGHRALEPLGLAAVAVRRHDHPPGHADRGLAAVIGAHELHAQVDPGGQPGAGQHRSLIHPQHVRVDFHRRVPGGELAGVLPVRGGPAVIEQSRRGQREGTRADRDHPRAPGGGLAQGRAHPLTGIASGR